MPVQPSLASQIAAMPDKRKGALWHGPCADGPLGGVTQSMIGKWLGCRERFRVKYILGLSPPERWSKLTGFGNMWHAAEEAHAANRDPAPALLKQAQADLQKHPMDREEIAKWFSICCVQFPEYVKHWREHPDVTGRMPLMQEQVFDVQYELPSGRTVRLRGKFDSVDLIDGGVWLQENKTKSEVDALEIQRQLKFDLQTCYYQIALRLMQVDEHRATTNELPLEFYKREVRGVRYNVVRRDCPIRKHKEKCTKPRYGTGRNAGKLLHPGSVTPAETDEHFYQRLLSDYIQAEPSEWFLRLRSEVSARDIKIFKETCLDPILEQMCWWYDEVAGVKVDYGAPNTPYRAGWLMKALNYRMPFGVCNALVEGGATEYDAFFESGSTAGMVETKMFTELQDANAAAQ